MCPLFEVGSLCTSRCSTCGTLCEAFPISDVNSAALYSSQACTVIIGDLYILNLPASMTRTILLAHLKTVQTIRGALFFKDNLYLSAMTFLSNLVNLKGAVYINNPQLIDARLFSLKTMNGNVTVEGCDRLCPARYTAVGTVVDQSGCANPQLEYFLHIEGPVTANDLSTISGIMATVVRNTTGGVVCPLFIDLFCASLSFFF